MKRYLHTRAEENTLTDADPPTANYGTLMNLLGGLANRLRAITGKSSWTASPDATLADAKTHHDRVDNPHSVTRAQLGAAAASALSSHTADQSNPHGVTASQAGARPATWVPGWNEVTGKPVSFPSSWSEVAGKPSVFAPTNHNDRHRAGGLDPLTASDVGAAPSSHVGSGGSAHPAATVSQAGFQSGTDKAKLESIGNSCVLSFSAGPTLTNDSWTDLLWTQESSDPYNWHVAGARDITPPPGSYIVTLYTAFNPNPNGVRRQRVMTEKSGGFRSGVENFTDPSRLGFGTQTATYQVVLETGDFIYVQALQSSGGTLNMLAGCAVIVTRIS